MYIAFVLLLRLQGAYFYEEEPARIYFAGCISVGFIRTWSFTDKVQVALTSYAVFVHECAVK